MHIESFGCSATAPGAAGAAAVAFTGDSLIMKYGTAPRIVQVNCDYQANGFFQMNWPSCHDTTRGYRCRVVASEPTPRMVLGLSAPINPLEAITATIAGSAVAGDVESAIVHAVYDQVPGAQQRLARWSEVQRRTEMLTTVDLSLAVTAGPGWSGAEAINADSDLLRAGRDYALLGIEIGVECAAVAVRGPDTAGVRIAVPGSQEFADLAQDWFCVLSRSFGDMPLIPILNADNKANILIDAAQDENAAAVTCSLMLAMLK